nr:SRPBCC family protein [uncultured Cupriavidus sp.]
MEIEQRFTLDAAPERVWQAFDDVRLLVNCLPGASIAADADADLSAGNVPLLFKVKLGPIAAAFKGQGELQRDPAARTGAFSGSAVDGKTQSRVKGVARFALQPDDAGGTAVTVAVDYTITGALAQFSREGIVRALAEQLTRDFAQNLQAALPQGVAVDAVGEVPVTARPALHSPNASIDLWSVLKAWLRQWWTSRRKTS